MKLNWNFLGDEGVQNKKPSREGGVWIFLELHNTHVTSKCPTMHCKPVDMSCMLMDGVLAKKAKMMRNV